jgi:two-component system chemotaxis response regulator CheY
MQSNPPPDARRVLVAEDDPDVRRRVASAVRLAGFEPVAAEGARDAARLVVRDANFCAAVFDVRTEGGAELARLVRAGERRARVPVVMIMAGPEGRWMKECRDAGVAVFLPNSFTSAQLQAVLRMLARPGLQNSNGAARPAGGRQLVRA